MRVVVLPGEGLKIETPDPRQSLIVRDALDGYDEFKSIVQDWSPSNERAIPARQSILILASISLLFSFVTMAISNTRPVVLTAAAVFILTFVYAVLTVRRSPNYEADMKRKMTFLGLFMVIIALARVFVLFTSS